ncbi:MAG: PAS domain-containing protein [Sphingomicrobium sp.]
MSADVLDGREPALSPEAAPRLVDSAGAAEEADAVEFLRSSGLPLSSVVLGLLDQSDDCIKVIGIDGSLQFMNCNGKKAMQVDDFCAIAGKPWPSLWPEDARPLLVDAMEEARAGRINRFEAFCPTAKGEPRWWEVTVSPVRSPSGSVAAILSTSRDISDRRQREDAMTVVAAEMRHRLRNAHAISAALLMASAHADSAHLDFARTVAARMARLADVQAKLLDVDGGLPLARMCDDVSRVFSESGGNLVCDGLPDVHLNEDRARTVSLVLGELTTNSLKHGALGRGGTARLSGRLDDQDLVLDWVESRGDQTEAVSNVSSGQGSALMARILKLYRGSIASGMTETGYQATIRLPLN